MTAYSKIDPVERCLYNINTGDEGWGFTMWSNSLIDDDAPHRRMLERLAAARPGMRLTLPEWWQDEDYVEGRLEWDAHTVSIYYETILSHLSLWSPEREAVVALREFLMGLDLVDTPPP